MFEATALIGQQLDRYRIESLLGEGGFGAVYRARHMHLDRIVALKVLKDTAHPQMQARFLREAELVGRIRSPHVVRIFDCGIATYPFLALELLEGQPLTGWLSSPVPLGDALAIVDQMLSGLSAAHRAGVIHRDIKPSNVFLRESADGYEAVLLDFGIAKAPSEASSLTRSGVMMGTPHYAAPEQLSSAKGVDYRADLYAIGVLLYRILSGTFPFDTGGYERMLVAIARRARTPLQQVAPHVPSPLAALIDRLVARDADLRPPTAEVLQSELRAACSLAARQSQEVLRTHRMTQTLPVP